MCEKRKITVEITNKSYNMIRRRVESQENKTSRVLSRYLFTFLKILTDGEHTLEKKFSREQARNLYYVLRRIHYVDNVSWDELSFYPAQNLSKVVELFNDSNDVPIATVATLNPWEIIALMEYAQTDDAGLFEAHTARFVG